MNIMLLRKIINRILSSDKTGQAIANLDDVISLPSRKKLSESKLNTLNQYIKLYRNILASKKILTSIDLNSVELQENMKLYIKLLLNILMKDVRNNTLDDIVALTYKTDKAESSIELAKIKLYHSKIKEMEEEAVLRLMALKEIYIKDVFLSLNKKNCIYCEINNLTSAYLIFINQKRAIELEIDSYLKNINTLANENLADEYEYLNYRKDELDILLNEVLPDAKLKDNHRKISKSLRIALMEHDLEVFAHQYQDDLIKLKQDLNAISKENFTIENRETLLIRIRKLELRYKVFANFGRNFVSEDEINSLYELKFKILALDIIDFSELVKQEKVNFMELECYFKIIDKKIEDILKNENQNLKEVFYENTIQAITLIAEILKSNNEYSAWKILTDKEKLGLLLSFDSCNGLENFFKNFKVSRDEYSHLDFHEKMFKWEENISLEVVLWLMENDESQDKTDLFKLYKLLQNSNGDRNEFRFPEGLVKICILETDEYVPNMNKSINDETTLRDLMERLINIDSGYILKKSEKISDCDMSLLKIIRENAKNKMVVMPTSLKYLEGKLFLNIPLLGVILNEGLTDIGNYVFYNSHIKEILLPSTLVTIREDAFNIRDLNAIAFGNYKDSQILNDDFLLEKFICMTFYSKKTGNTHIHQVSDRIRQKQEAYWEGRYSTFCDSELYMHDMLYEDIVYCSYLNKFLFLDKNAESLVLEKSDLEYLTKRARLLGNSSHESKICSQEIKELIKNLQEKLKLKTENKPQELMLKKTLT